MNDKFRVWDNQEGKYVDARNFAVTNEGVLYHINYLRFSDNHEVKSISPVSKNRYTVEHSTGLKDKNKTEIYEGDRVRLVGDFKLEGIFDIEKEIGNWGYEFDWVCISGYQCSTHILGDIDKNNSYSNCEIVGTIHDEVVKP